MKQVTPKPVLSMYISDKNHHMSTFFLHEDLKNEALLLRRHLHRHIHRIVAGVRGTLSLILGDDDTSASSCQQLASHLRSDILVSADE